MTDYTDIPNHISIRLADAERRIIAAILNARPHLKGKVSGAVSWALFEAVERLWEFDARTTTPPPAAGEQEQETE